MRLSEDIRPISYVKANSGKVLEQVNISGPVVITQNGEAAAVLMGVRDYDKLREGVALLKILAASSKSLEEGSAVPVESVFQRLHSRMDAERSARG